VRPPTMPGSQLIPSSGLQLPGHRAAQLHAEALSQGTDRRTPAPGRRMAVHRANISFTTSFPSPCRPPQVSNTMGESKHPSARRGWRFPDLSAPPCYSGMLRRCLAGPSRRLGGGGLWPGPPRGPAYHTMLQQDFRRARSVSVDAHLTVMRNSGVGKDLAEMPICPSPKADFLHDTACSPKT